jgi:hypothetical protein
MAIDWGRSIGYNLDKRTVKNTMEITERIYNGCDCYPWRPVFAWLPVKTIHGRYVWFKKIYKRKYWAVWGASFHMEPIVEYGELFDIL